MSAYTANGFELGWLIDLRRRRVTFYRGSGIEILESPTHLIREGPVAGFVLAMKRIWDPGWYHRMVL